MARIAFIDADELAYKVALKYEEVWYEVYKDDVLKWRYRLKEESAESIGTRDDLEIVRKRVELDPRGYEDDLDRLVSKIISDTTSTDTRLYLSGDNNFRYDLSTLLPYKGTRDDSTKPFHLKLVKDRIRELGGESVDFLEADDMMSAAQTLNVIKGKHESIICSSDKDLRTVPGLNFNIGKGKVTNISNEEANYNFFYQLLIGDPTDNIPSPYGLGAVGATKFLEPLLGSSQLQYYNSIVPFYLNQLKRTGKDGKYKTPWYIGQDINSILLEIGNLLWMRRSLDKDERWNPLDQQIMG